MLKLHNNISSHSKLVRGLGPSVRGRVPVAKCLFEEVLSERRNTSRLLGALCTLTLPQSLSLR